MKRITEKVRKVSRTYKFIFYSLFKKDIKRYTDIKKSDKISVNV